MTDIFGRYESQTTKQLRQIDSSKYPDTNKDVEANLVRLNQFVDYIAQYLQTMQKGVDQATMDPISRYRDTIFNFAALLGGGELLYGIDLGDLQYFLPALGAMFGFDQDVPFPINLLYAAENFFLGYVVPLDSWNIAVEEIIGGWMTALGLDDDFIAAVTLLLDNMGRFTGDLLEIFNDLTGLLGVFDIFDFVGGPIGPIWAAFSDLLSNFTVANLGAIADPFLETLTPWIDALAQLIGSVDDFLETFTAGIGGGSGTMTNPLNWLTDLLNMFGGLVGLGSGSPSILDPDNIPILGPIISAFLGGSTDIQGIANLGQLFHTFTDLFSGVFDPITAWFEIITGALSTSLLGGVDLTNTNPVVSQIDAMVSYYMNGVLNNSDNGFNNIYNAIASAMGWGSNSAVNDVFDALKNIPGLNIISLILSSIVPSLDATKIGSGTFSDSFIPGLLSKLGINVFNASAQAGPNTVLGPGFEDTTISRNYSGAAGSGYSNERTHSGNMAFKIVAVAGWDELDLTPVAGGTFVQDPSKSIKVVPGQKWYASVWTYARSANVGTNKAAIGVMFTDSSGVNSVNYNTLNGVLTTVPVSTWTQISGYITVPAGYDRMLVYWFDDNPTTAGNQWHIDDAEVYQETASQNIIQQITSAFLGGSLPSTIPLLSDALAAMQAQWNQTVQNTNNIQSLQSAALANVVSGKTVSINFANYANGPLPSIFTVGYATVSGAPTSTLVVQDGMAQWNLVNDGSRTATVMYNVAPTDTDFQIVRGTMAQAPGEGGARIWAFARGDSPTNPQNGVWARAYSVGWLQWRADIGYRLAGSDVVWVSNIPITWSMDIYWKVGVGTNARQYELWSGNTLVYTYNEVGTTTHVGSGYRYWGAISEMKTGAFGPSSPGKISGTSVSDNSPASVLGSQAHIYRTNTGIVNLTGGNVWTALPTNFFGSTLRASSDIAVDLVNGKFTALKSRPYNFNFRCRLSGAVNALVYVGLYKNGVLDQVSDAHWPSQGGGMSIGGHFSTNLQINDVVEIRTLCSGLTISTLTGEATGTETFFNMTSGGGVT
jgi:hypothetical protein